MSTTVLLDARCVEPLLRDLGGQFSGQLDSPDSLPPSMWNIHLAEDQRGNLKRQTHDSTGASFWKE